MAYNFLKMIPNTTAKKENNWQSTSGGNWGSVGKPPPQLTGGPPEMVSGGPPRPTNGIPPQLTGGPPEMASGIPPQLTGGPPEMASGIPFQLNAHGGGGFQTANKSIPSQLSAHNGGGFQTVQQPGSTYTPGYTVGNTDGENAQKTGLGTASNILSDTLGKSYDYPGNIANQLRGPATMGIDPNVGYNPLQMVEGLKANNYMDLQHALQAPIKRQGQEAQQRIADQYSGQGLYGSVGGGLMSGAQADSQFATQDALSNAVAERYRIQLEDQAQQIGQNLNLFGSQAQTADQINAYNQARNQTNYGNQQAQNDFFNNRLAQNQQYGLDRQSFNTGIDEMNYQRALQLAGQGNSGAMVQANQQAASDAAKAAQTGALFSGIGAIGGGLMGNYDGSGNSGWNFGGVGDAISSGYDWLTG